MQLRKNTLVLAIFLALICFFAACDEAPIVEPDHIITEAELDAINAAWAKEHTSVFANSVEDAMRRTRNGGHYFGKYGDTIVIWRPSVTCLVLKFSMNGHAFTFGSGNMYFFKGKDVYNHDSVASAGILTDEEIDALYEYYTDEYSYYGDTRIYNYPAFVADLEYLSQKTMKEINDAYDTWKRSELYNRYVFGLSTDEPSAENKRAQAREYVNADLGNDPHRFFNKEKHHLYQYYGKFGDCVLLASENHYFTLLTVSVAGYDFELEGTGELIVYRKGSIMSVDDALRLGYMAEEQISKVHERYLAYQEYLEGAEVAEADSETTAEKFEAPIPSGGLNYVEHVGEVPEQFKKIIERGAISPYVQVEGDMLLESYREGDKYRIIIKDKYGNEVSNLLVGGSSENISDIRVDSQGNLIARAGPGSMANPHSRIVKAEPSGKILFETSMANVNAGFDYMIEIDEGYVFVGTCIGEKVGYWDTTDISIVLITHSGEIKQSIQVGGDYYDTLHHVEKNGNGVSIYFKMINQELGGSYQRCDVDGKSFEYTYTEINEADIPGYEYFRINGKPYYAMTDFFKDYKWNKTAGSAVIEYDDFVLLVYERFTSDYDLASDGFMSTVPVSFWYRETVYEAYTKTGELIWRTAIDSTAYDTIKEHYSE